MKKLILIITIPVLFLILFYPKLTPYKKQAPAPSPPLSVNSSSNLSPSPYKKKLMQKEVVLNNYTYTLYLQPVETIDLLIPNYTERKSSQNIIEHNNCQVAINAGFYTKDNKPLGGLIINRQEITRNLKDDNLLTGYLWKADDGKIILNDTPPFYQPQFLIQAGPFFNAFTKPTFSDKQRARRSFALSFRDSLILGMIVNKDNLYSGPELSEIPQIIKKAGIEYEKILNLDGGSASVFYSKELPSENKLSELANVGSILCAK